MMRVADVKDPQYYLQRYNNSLLQLANVSRETTPYYCLQTNKHPENTLFFAVSVERLHTVSPCKICEIFQVDSKFPS